MKALVLQEFGSMKVEDRAVPACADGDVLVRVVATGICGSDLHGYTGANGRRHPGQVMGHETVGIVTEKGDSTEGRIEVGQLVTINPVVSCGSCVKCEAGEENACDAKYVIGVDPTVSAAFAEYVVAPAGNVVSLGGLIDPALGALVEPCAVGVHAANKLGDAQAVLVIGGGPVGQAVALAAARRDANVLVSEPSPERRAICQEVGLATFDPSEESIVDAAIREFGRLADGVVDAVGTSSSLNDALTASSPGSVIVLVGMGSPELSVSAYSITTAERSVVGAFSYSAAEFREAAEWVSSNPAGLSTLIGKRVPAAEGPQAFADLADSGALAGKVLVEFSSVE
ncbi:zinc-dependent alcohol dehydrogenase [Aeromicrobium sp. P5_D10]